PFLNPAVVAAPGTEPPGPPPPGYRGRSEYRGRCRYRFLVVNTACPKGRKLPYSIKWIYTNIGFPPARCEPFLQMRRLFAVEQQRPQTWTSLIQRAPVFVDVLGNLDDVVAKLGCDDAAHQSRLDRESGLIESCGMCVSGTEPQLPAPALGRRLLGEFLSQASEAASAVNHCEEPSGALSPPGHLCLHASLQLCVADGSICLDLGSDFAGP